MDALVKRKINFMYLQEIKWMGEKSKELENSGFKLRYIGKVRMINRMEITVENE